MSTPSTGDTTTARTGKAQLLEAFPQPEYSWQTREFTGDETRHSDARNIRGHFHIPRYDPSAFEYPNIVPNILEYQWDADADQIAGGTDLLGTGKPGSGKSTLLNHLALRASEINRSKVVWRASTSRSEWLPLGPWVKLCLPAGTDPTAQLVPRVPTDPQVELSIADLEGTVVREVAYYDSVRDLNETVLERGKLHVVYPDPKMRGCQAAYERSEEKQYDAPTGRSLFDSQDPSTHFWFGWVLDRVERGPHDWTTLILDEIGDIAPQSARKDDYGTYQKIELLRDCWVDARKKGLSIYAFGHAETDIHQFIRHKIRWRIAMNGSANPTSKNDVVGFDSIPMEEPQTKHFDVGEALAYNERNFEKIAWPNYEAPVDHKLELRLGG
jgi:energy-coupling factor transporter ATP-binding protein EcfA2